MAHTISEFQRTGFYGALNYYRAAEPYFHLSAAFKGAKVTQPSFYMSGRSDNLRTLYPPLEKLRAGLPGLVDSVELEGIGHWIHHEAKEQVNKQLLQFLQHVAPV